jgi:hypothetical protein
LRVTLAKLLDNVAGATEAFGDGFESLPRGRHDAVGHALDVCKRDAEEIPEVVPEFLRLTHA